MSANTAQLAAGSHGRDELPVIPNYDEDQKSMEGNVEMVTSKECKICGDEIGKADKGELFVACRDCSFPVCRPCYEYERREGNGSCPQCSRRYKRQKGCARVPGDEEDDYGFDDFEEDEFQLNKNPSNIANPDHQNQHEEEEEEGEPVASVPVLSSIAGSVVGKEFDAEQKDGYFSNAEWKERVEKWKARQEKKGSLINANNGGAKHNEEEEEDDFL